MKPEEEEAGSVWVPSSPGFLVVTRWSPCLPFLEFFTFNVLPPPPCPLLAHGGRIGLLLAPHEPAQ